MIKYYKHIFIAMFLALTCLLIACQTKNTSATYYVVAEDIKINSAVLNSENYGETDVFENIIASTPADDLPYVKPDETITITILGIPSGTYEIKDYILTDTGCAKYAKETIQTYTIEFDDSSASFTLERN